MDHFERVDYKNRIRKALKRNPLVGILGPRQVGKTTLAREIANEWKNQGLPVHYFDLEHPQDVIRLEEPVQALSDLKGLVIFDEVQRRPDLYPFLRVLADRDNNPAKFLVLGSASGDLLKQSSESLAGRIEYIEIQGFGINEINTSDTRLLWLRGGFPRSFLAENEEDSFIWRDECIRTFIERDIPLVWQRVPPVEMWRVWQMAAHYHGQIINFSEMGRSLGISNIKIKQYIDVLTDMFMARQLQPWFDNVGKRMVKQPKFYIRDSGILNTLLGIRTREDLERNPKLGAIWEGFALEQVLRLHDAPRSAFFWSTHGGAEIDLLLNEGGSWIGYEFKYADAPRTTKSMIEAQKTLNLKEIRVVVPGDISYDLKNNIQVVGIETLQLKNPD